MKRSKQSMLIALTLGIAAVASAPAFATSTTLVPGVDKEKTYILTQSAPPVTMTAMAPSKSVAGGIYVFYIDKVGIGDMQALAAKDHGDDVYAKGDNPGLAHYDSGAIYLQQTYATGGGMGGMGGSGRIHADASAPPNGWHTVDLIAAATNLGGYTVNGSA